MAKKIRSTAAERAFEKRADERWQETVFVREDELPWPYTVEQFQGIVKELAGDENAANAVVEAAKWYLSGVKSWDKSSRTPRRDALQRNGKITARIEELRVEQAKRHEVTVDSLTIEVNEAIAFARERGQSGPLPSLLKLKAQLHGQLVERRRVEDYRTDLLEYMKEAQARLEAPAVDVTPSEPEPESSGNTGV